jgi:hypothetical protein
MGLFQRKRFVWYEPWFFQQRIRTPKAWVLFSLLLLAVALAVGAALFFSAPAGQPINLLETIGLSVGLAAAVWWVLDGTNTRRQAVLFEDSIVVGGDMGKYSHPDTYKLSEIAAAAIVLPEESKWPEPALFFHYKGEEQAIGIESKAGLARLAQAIHEAGVPVRLDGWQPDQESVLKKTFSWRADLNHIVEKAQMERLPPGSASMMTVGGILVAIVRQSWAIVVWLLITGYAVYYGYQNWKDLDLFRFGLLFVIPIGAMYIAGLYTDRFASAATSHGLTRMAKDQIRKREGLQLNPDAEDLIPVEIFLRDQFDKTIQKIHEMGFLQADHRGGRMLFEGKKERWSIPARSIRSLAIEEVQTGAPGQSALGALNYYVVVQFVADEDQEFGFRYSERDFGELNDVKRAEGAIYVFEAFESLLPSQ